MNSDHNNKIDENKLKKSFFLIKKDILRLKNEINLIKYLLKRKIELKRPKKVSDSIRSQGVLINNQSIINQQSINEKHTKTNPQEAKKALFNKMMELENIFKSLTEREFHIFILIYQLEEEKGRVTYKDISDRLNLTDSMIRGRVSMMIQKSVPIIRSRPYHKITYLSVPKEIRDLNLVGELIKMKDPVLKQKTLFEV